MKLSYLSLCAAGVIAAASPFTLSAQDAPAAGAKPARQPVSIEARLEKMKTNLTLTDDQVAKLKTIFEEQKTKIDPIMADTTLTRDQKREKMKPITDETRTKVEAVLTPEQKTKYEAARKDRQQNQPKKAE